MADFPTTIFEARETENLPGLVYNPADKKNMYSEDFQNLGAEITALETVLGTLPAGDYDTIREALEALFAGAGIGDADSVGDFLHALDFIGDDIYEANEILMADSADGFQARKMQVGDLLEWAQIYSDGYFQPLLTAAVFGAFINARTGKTTPVDADMVPLMDSAASNAAKKLSWANIKATLKTYFDTLYNLYVWATDVHAATGKTTPVDADELAIVDSAASNVLKKLTWANLKATLKTYFDTLYPPSGYTLMGNTTISTPLDSTTYFFGSPGFAGGTTAGFYTFRFPKAGTIKKIIFQNYISGTTPSSETSTINLKLNGGANQAILSNTFDNQVQGKQFISGALSIAVVEGDNVEFNWPTPAWATNPGTSIMIKVTMYVEVG